LKNVFAGTVNALSVFQDPSLPIETCILETWERLSNIIMLLLYRSIAALELPVEGSSMIGKTVSPFRVIEKLGAGGIGEVHRAHNTTMARQVAIKMLPVDAKALADEAAASRVPAY
jgi:hypothetical protein